VRQRDLIDALYRAFAAYARPERAMGCTHCWSADEMAAVRDTPLRDLDGDLAERLLWETADHWQDTPAYKHYLPRLLELLVAVEDVYPGHVLETMRALDFPVWPAAEQDAVRSYLDTLDESLEALPGLEDESSRIEWRRARAALDVVS
jgi:hypothetical protein